METGFPVSDHKNYQKKMGKSVVHQNRKANGTDTMSYLGTRFLPKTAHPQHVQQKIPVNVIISFFYVQFAWHTWFLMTLNKELLSM
jgi:hypothetical protein